MGWRADIGGSLAVKLVARNSPLDQSQAKYVCGIARRLSRYDLLDFG